MSGAKRRKLERGVIAEDGDADDAFSECDFDAVTEGDENAIGCWRDFLLASKDDIARVQQIKSRIQQKTLTSLLSVYNATESEKDKAIYDILCTLERDYKMSLRPIFPLVWGERSKDNYEKLHLLGPVLHTRLTPDQVLDYLDPTLMWNTLLQSEQTTARKIRRRNSSQHLYDSRFILRLLASLLNKDTEVSSRKFINVNGLSFAFAGTSFVRPSERSVAYLVLKRFLAHLMKVNAEIFPEKCLYIYLLQLFKNSIENALQRLPHVVAHFFARVTKLLLHPEDPVYQPVVSFLLLKPDVDLENVPEMYKLLMSCSTQFHDTERHWCLRLITDSLIEPNDYNILQKRYGIKLFLSLFGSSIADRQTRKYILLSLRAALQHRSVANDLYRRQNLHSWIVLSLQDERLTRWESIFLCQLFTTLIKRIKKIWRRNAKNGARESEWRKNITQNTCQILGSKVCEVLRRENDYGKTKWLPKLEKLLSESW